MESWRLALEEWRVSLWELNGGMDNLNKGSLFKDLVVTAIQFIVR